MKLPFRRHRKISRGQALVEFAFILPILLLLMLLAIDFGRVFFGWVALNNATRIAANEAALNPTAWVAPGDVADQDRYRQQVLNDLQAINCAPVGGGTWDLVDVPDPVFENKGGTSDPHEVGDHAAVAIECDFTFLTPVIGTIIGNPMNISARSQFAVRGGFLADLPMPTPSPTPTPDPTPTPTPLPSGALCTVPQMVGQTVVGGEVFWTLGGFTGNYTAKRPPNSNYVIGLQSLVGGQQYPCDTSITVQHN